MKNRLLGPLVSAMAFFPIPSLGMPTCAAQQDISNVTITILRLSDKTYLLQGKLGDSTYGGNIVASIGSDGILLVDSEYLALSDRVRDALRKLTDTDRPVRFLINTHWHKDHTEGDKAFGKEATIIAHDEVRNTLSRPQTLFGRTAEPYPAYALPTITFADSLTLHFNGEEIRVIHFPHGHTAGDSIVFFPSSKVAHIGDLYIGPIFPFVDFDHGGDVIGLEKDIRTILELLPSDTRVVPGHRTVTDLAALRTYERMLSISIATVQKGIAEGKTLRQLQDVGLPPEWKSWEWEALKAPQWIEYVYRSLTETDGPS